jgi:hypothetical protein
MCNYREPLRALPNENREQCRKERNEDVRPARAVPRGGRCDIHDGSARCGARPLGAEHGRCPSVVALFVRSAVLAAAPPLSNRRSIDQAAPRSARLECRVASSDQIRFDAGSWPHSVASRSSNSRAGPSTCQPRSGALPAPVTVIRMRPGLASTSSSTARTARLWMTLSTISLTSFAAVTTAWGG